MNNIRVDLSTGRRLTMTQGEIDRRIGAVRQFMAQAGLGLILVVNPGLDGLRYWLTGVGGPERSSEGGVIIGKKGDIISVQGGRLVPPGGNLEKNYSQAVVGGNSGYEGIRDMDGFDGACIRWMAGECTRMGVVHMDWLRADLQAYLIQFLPDVNLVDVTMEINGIKARKSCETVAMLENNAQMLDRVFGAACGFIQPEIYERDLVNQLRYVAYMQGCGGQDYEESAMLWLRSCAQAEDFSEDILSYPGRRLAAGDMISMRMYGLGSDNVYGGLCRSFTMGKATEAVKRLWQAAVRAQELAVASLNPGSCLADAAGKVNAYLTSHGFAPDTGEFIHGMDYAADTYPKLRHISEHISLEAGTVLMVEPVVSDGRRLPVCCGDMYVIANGGARRLNRFPQTLVEL